MTASLEHVPALDGVRGIAVALVLAYHFEVPGLGGGFLGVDLFFVLSGFLITSLLLREFASTGRIDLVRFWLRRARRLLPAVFLFIGIAALFAATASPFDKASLRGDLLSSIFYVTNWRFITVGQSYFAEYATPSPVRHLWSLAIEEQFYILWPILVLGALAVIMRSRRRLAARFVAAILVAAAAASAVLLAISWNETDPSLAYYSTLTRAHELLLGALGAALLFYRPGVREAIRRRAGLVTAIGLGGILAAGLLMSDTDAFYYMGGSVLFSLVAVVLVLAVMTANGSRSIATRALEVRPLVWLGAVSYGVYLWHWPMAVLVTPESTGLDGLPLLAIRIGATLLIAAASFYIVERPIRRGRIRHIRLEPRIAFSGAAVIAVGLAGLTVAGTRGAQPLPSFLSDNMDIIGSTIPGAHGTVALIGDSVAMSLYPGLVHEAGAAGLNVVSATFPGCSSGDTLRADDTGKLFHSARTCARNAVEKQSELIATDDPSVVFWLSSRDRYSIKVDGVLLPSGSQEWRKAVYADWDRTLARLTRSGAPVALILPLYGETGIPSKCAGLEYLAEAKCITPWVLNGPLRALYADWAKGHPDKVVVIDIVDELCPTVPCPADIDGIHLRMDGVHLTTEGSILVARMVLARLPAELRP